MPWIALCPSRRLLPLGALRGGPEEALVDVRHDDRHAPEPRVGERLRERLAAEQDDGELPRRRRLAAGVAGRLARGDDDAELGAVVDEVAAEVGHVAARGVGAAPDDPDGVPHVGEPHALAGREDDVLAPALRDLELAEAELRADGCRCVAVGLDDRRLPTVAARDGLYQRYFDSRPMIFPARPEYGETLVLGTNLTWKYVKYLSTFREKDSDTVYHSVLVAELGYGSSIFTLYFEKDNGLVLIRTPGETFRRK